MTVTRRCPEEALEQQVEQWTGWTEGGWGWGPTRWARAPWGALTQLGAWALG